MTYDHIIKGTTTEAVWGQVTSDLLGNKDALEYRTLIEQDGRKVYLSVEIDPGGGFEGGYELTTIYAPVPATATRFAIHHEGFFDEIGKFFGMQDIVTGYADFDNKIIVKGDNEDFVKQLFGKENVRLAFKDLYGFSLGITNHSFGNENETGTLLEFQIDEAILNPANLLNIYKGFIAVLLQYEAV